MTLEFIKKYQIAFFILFIFFALSIVLLTKESDKPSLPQEENKTQEPNPKIIPKLPTKTLTKVKKKVTLKEQNSSTSENLAKYLLRGTLIVNDTIDFVGTNEPLMYAEPQLEIGEIMEDYKIINTFSQDKYLTDKKDDWKIDYEVGLEESSIEDLKANGKLKTEMLNGKIEFSKSF